MLAFQGFVDTNLANRVAKIQEILSGCAGCPKLISTDTIHRGKHNERIPTKVTLIEFQSNAEREKALTLLSGKNLNDSTGASLTCKRAKTSAQKERNTKLQNAEKEIQKHSATGDNVKIEWETRRVLCKNLPAFVQHKDDSSGDFLPPFANLRV